MVEAAWLEASVTLGEWYFSSSSVGCRESVGESPMSSKSLFVCSHHLNLLQQIIYQKMTSDLPMLWSSKYTKLSKCKKFTNKSEFEVQPSKKVYKEVYGKK